MASVSNARYSPLSRRAASRSRDDVAPWRRKARSKFTALRHPAKRRSLDLRIDDVGLGVDFKSDDGHHAGALRAVLDPDPDNCDLDFAWANGGPAGHIVDQQFEDTGGVPRDGSVVALAPFAVDKNSESVSS